MHQLIRASAGSGKTFKLSNHFLKQLFLGNAPETILATTFTRKAAGEILGRVLMRLAGAAQDSAAAAELAEQLKPADVTQARSRQLLAGVTAELHRVRVCTLDSFFQQVARSLTLELGLPPGWSIVDDATDRDLRQQAIDAVLSQHVPKDAQRLMQMLAKGRSKRSVRDLINDTVENFYDLFLQTDQDAWQRIPKLPRLTGQELQQTIADLQECELPDRKNSADTRAADIARFESGDMEKFLTTGFAKSVFEGHCTYYKKPLPESLVESCRKLVSHAKAELLDALRQQTIATYRLIERFDREYARLRSEHGWLGFNDVTRTLARSHRAADGDRMNFRLDSSIRHLLLDEFQDTSPDQWSVLKRLALNIAERSTPDETKGSFFCVGDPKQAIYGWRGGVAEILDSVERTIPDIAATSQDESRRSSTAVINTVNRVFRHIDRHAGLDDYEGACRDWSSAFPEHSTVHTDRPGFVQLRTSPKFEGDNADERREPYFEWVAQQVRELHQQAPGAEIGVLTVRNATVARLVHKLTLMGVPASEEGGTAPVDSPAVLAVFSLLHLAGHPGCEVSRFHVATSPLADLAGLHTWNDDTEAAESAARIRARLMDDGYGRTLQWISNTVRPVCSQRDLLRLKQIVAEGWKFDQSPSLSPTEFVRLLEGSRLSKAEPAPVRVMTIHQSKGLEFDVVVLPELDGARDLFRSPKAAVGGPGGDAPPDSVCLWRKKELRPLLPEALRRAFEQTTERDVREALCKLYVALTRAVHALHMLVPPVEKGKSPKTFAGLLLAALCDDDSDGENEVLYETGDEFWFNNNPKFGQPRPHDAIRPDPALAAPKIRLQPMPGGRIRGLRREAPSKHEPDRLYISSRSGKSDGIPEESGWQRPDAADSRTTAIDPRTKGTLFHAWFEAILWLDEATLPEDGAWYAIAESNGIDKATTDLLLPDFLRILKQSEVRQTLSRSAALARAPFAELSGGIRGGQYELSVENERSFVFRRSGAIVQGTIDRLVLLSKNGRPAAAEIIDFKTDRLFGDSAIWAADRIAHYGPQLDVYREAVAHCFRVDPDAIVSRLLLLEADVLATTNVHSAR
ncbi:MAG: UvrD-helicase domain-containing protein [Planctomycetaceae bacterium]